MKGNAGFEPRDKGVQQLAVEPHERLNVMLFVDGTNKSVVKVPHCHGNKVRDANVDGVVHARDEEENGTGDGKQPYQEFERVDAVVDTALVVRVEREGAEDKERRVAGEDEVAARERRVPVSNGDGVGHDEAPRHVVPVTLCLWSAVATQGVGVRKRSHEQRDCTKRHDAAVRKEETLENVHALLCCITKNKSECTRDGELEQSVADEVGVRPGNRGDVGQQVVANIRQDGVQGASEVRNGSGNSHDH